jgi:hypothetical protein
MALSLVDIEFRHEAPGKKYNMQNGHKIIYMDIMHTIHMSRH